MIGKPLLVQSEGVRASALVSIWLLGNIWTYQWFFETLSKISVLNGILLILGLVILGIKLIHRGIEVSSIPRYKPYPILLMLGGELGAIAVRWTLDIPQLTLMCFILGSYGLVGLFIDDTFWRKNLSLAAITALIVPFMVAFNSGLGYPIRVITAHTVAEVLSNFHFIAVSSHDIILMENGIAQVDLPCSGIKSLWMGTIFLLGATWLENRRLGFGWILVAIANLMFLIVANVVRVLILVVIIEVARQQQIADILHLPLGIVCFIFASALTWILLQKVPHKVSQQTTFITKDKIEKRKFNSNWLLIVILTLGIIGQFKPISKAVALTSIELPPTIVTQPIDLTPAEARFFDNPANPLVQKLRFQADALSGSMLIVASNSWQPHHPPELCFTGNGFKIDSMNSKQIDSSINARWISLQNGALSAIYWFQSPQTTTDDFVNRIWEHLSNSSKTWVLVSVLFDDAENPDGEVIKNFSNGIYGAIAHTLNG